jgi:hypothetical protein
MTLLPAAPPGPIAGQPGHFAHHNWLEANQALLSMPLPGFAIAAPTTQTFVTLSYVIFAGVSVPIVNPHPSKLLRCFCHWQFQSTVTQTIMATINSTGATVIGEGGRDSEIREGPSGSTITGHATRIVDLNTGTTTISMGGKLLAAGSQPMSFGKLVVIPVGYV